MDDAEGLATGVAHIKAWAPVKAFLDEVNASQPTIFDTDALIIATKLRTVAQSIACGEECQSKFDELITSLACTFTDGTLTVDAGLVVSAFDKYKSEVFCTFSFSVLTCL